MRVIQFNPFRYLGLFANATLKEQTAAVTQMKAFARVGQKMDNPLRLPHCFGELLVDEETIIENESLLALPDERKQHAFFWFAHGPDPEEDLKAINLIDQGLTNEAIVIWEKRPDREALQNLMVTALLREDLKEATRLAQQLHQKEPDILWFALALTDEFKWLTMQMLRDYASGNEQWTAVLKDMQLTACRKNIEDCLENAELENDIDTYEALYEATADLDQLRDILGPDNITYQTLADQLAIALVMDKFAPFRVKDPLKWFDKAYEISVQEETRALVVYTTLSFFKEILNSPVESNYSSKEYQEQMLALISYDGPITELKEGIRSRVDNIKTVNHWKIGCGALGLLILIILHIILKPIVTRNNRNRPPEITLPEPIHIPRHTPYHNLDLPKVPNIKHTHPIHTYHLPEGTEIKHGIQELDSVYINISDEERQELIDSLPDPAHESPKEKTSPNDSVME